ncbi:MAG: hypothetical protein ABIH46_04065, partial [Chloroflexota bacterium]
LHQGPTPSRAQIESWWNSKGWGYVLGPDVLTAEPAPIFGEEVTLEHLDKFLTDLRSFQTKSTKPGGKGREDTARLL